MKNTAKRIIAILLAALMTGTFASCAKSPSATAATIEITDSTGNVIRLDKPAEKIISLLPSDTEILYSLGAQDKIIAVASICKYPPEVGEKTQIDTGVKTNVESIIAMDPDVVFMGKMAQTQDQADQMTEAGIKVIVTEPQTIADIYASIELIGKVVDKTKAADSLVASMKKGFADLKTEAETLTPKSVYFEVSPLQFGLYTTGTGTFANEIITMLGMTNVFSDLTGWPSVSEEQVIKRNPDVILNTNGGSDQKDATISEIMGRSNWQSINAIRNKKVFWIDGDKFNIPGPRLVESVREFLDLLK